MYQLLAVSLNKNLQPFQCCLRHYGIACKVTELNDQQVIWLADKQQLEVARDIYQQWHAGQLVLPDFVDRKYSYSLKAMAQAFFISWRKRLITLILIIITLAVVLLTQLGTDVKKVAWFSFTPFAVSNGMLYVQSFSVTWQADQYWRLVTPIFLHFSWLHLVFNTLWLFEFGKRIEKYSASVFPLLVLFSAVISNVSQYIFSVDQGALFGGFSGVIYALLGFCWVVERMKVCQYDIVPGIYGFMLIWLIICLTGALELIGFGKIANAAHIAGLLSGGFFGLGYSLIKKRTKAII